MIRGREPESYGKRARMPTPRVLRRAGAALAVAIVAVLAGYAALNVPGSWFPSASSRTFDPGQLAVSRGSAQAAPGALVVFSPSPDEAAIVVVKTDLRASDYAGIEWSVVGLPAEADVRLIWRSSFQPSRANVVAMRVDDGRLRPIVIAADPGWVGTIVGLGLAIRGTPREGVAIRSVTVRPLGAVELVASRIGEWLRFEGWRATSVESIAGGSDTQDLPLPVVLATAIALAAGCYAALIRFAPHRAPVPFAAFLFALFAVAWVVADLRFAFDLARQGVVTARTFAGKDAREAHLAADDAPLYRLVLEARAKLPAGPERVFVLAEAPYFRARAAYHLYPHNPWFDLFRTGVPEAHLLRPGDWVLSYRRRGVQYNRATQRLRFDGGVDLAAELVVLTPDGALFRLL